MIILITVLFVSLVSGVIQASPIVYNCGDLSQCKPNDKPICALDKRNMCFKQFPSECFMEYDACLLGIEYIKYVEEYCEYENFLCKGEQLWLDLTFEIPPEDSHHYNMEHDSHYLDVVYDDNYNSNNNDVFPVAANDYSIIVYSDDDDDSIGHDNGVSIVSVETE